MIDDFTKGAPKEKRPTENEIREAFNKLDLDGSGALELCELVPLVKGIIQDMENPSDRLEEDEKVHDEEQNPFDDKIDEEQ